MRKSSRNVIDANLDRAREGLRVVEDVARFELRDEKLTKELKDLRHEVTSVAKKLPVENEELFLARGDDVGAETYSDTEGKRETYMDLAKANFARTEEALRVLEEISKMYGSGSGKKFKKLRFEAYELEKKVTQKLKEKYCKRLPENGLYVIIDDTFENGKNCLQMAKEAVQGGADIIQLRMKNTPVNEIIDTAKELRKTAKENDVLLIIDDRVDAVLAAGADGVHLGRTDISVKDAREVLGDKIIGASGHSLEEAMENERWGADYTSVGPIFHTDTKDNLPGPLGLDELKEVRGKIGIPIVGIGGIDGSNIREVLEAGADCAAVLSEILKSDDIEAKTRELKEKTGNI